jgi:hypothetical protein
LGIAPYDFVPLVRNREGLISTLLWHTPSMDE